MQEEVNRRTLELEQQRQMSGMLTDAQADELVDLSEQQGKLAEMILNLVQQVMENPEDNPEDLPDVRDDEGLDDEGLDDELLRELDAGTSSKQDK